MELTTDQTTALLRLIADLTEQRDTARADFQRLDREWDEHERCAAEERASEPNHEEIALLEVLREELAYTKNNAATLAKHVDALVCERDDLRERLEVAERNSKAAQRTRDAAQDESRAAGDALSALAGTLEEMRAAICAVRGEGV